MNENMIDPVLVTRTYAGNLHSTASRINKAKLARYVLAMDYSSGHTIVVFLMEKKEADNWRGTCWPWTTAADTQLSYF